MKRLLLLSVLIAFVRPVSATIQYSGGVVVNTTFTNTAGTRLEIVSGLVAALTTAGWGTVSGTTDVIMNSATTPTASNQIRAEILDPGSGNCAQVKIRNTAGTLISQASYLLPGVGKVWHVIANQYNFAIFTAGTSAAREFIMAGTLYIPTFLDGVITGDLGWIMANGVTDGSATLYGSFKTGLGTADTNGNGHFSAILNGSLFDENSGSGIGSMQLVTTEPSIFTKASPGQQWHDSTYLVSDPLLAFGITSISDNALIRGQIHNAIALSGGALAQDLSVTIDTHTWYVLTATNPGSNGQWAPGQILLATD